MKFVPALSFLEISITCSVPAVIGFLSHQVPKHLTVTHETLCFHAGYLQGAQRQTLEIKYIPGGLHLER